MLTAIYNFNQWTNKVDFLFFYDFRWFIDNEIVPGNHGTSLKLKKVGRESNNKIVKCEVNNVIGKSEQTETLDIHCKFIIYIQASV